MVLSRNYFPGPTLYVFRSELKAAESDLSIHNEFCEYTDFEHKAQEQLARFCPTDHYIEDRPQSGRPYGLDRETLQRLTEYKTQQTACQILKLWAYHISPWLSK